MPDNTCMQLSILSEAHLSTFWIDEADWHSIHDGSSVESLSCWRQDIVFVVGDSNLQKKRFTWYSYVPGRFYYNFMVYTEASVSITPEESIKQMKVSSPFPSSSGPLCARCINSRISYTNFHQLLVMSVWYPLFIISQSRLGSSDIGYRIFPLDVRSFEFVPQIGEFHMKICHCATLVDS